jgi:iron complex transport system substrate-binding protein
MERLMGKIVEYILLLTLILVVGQGAAYGAMHTDQVGRMVEVPDNPQRIITLVPSLTEIVYGLGQGQRIIAVTQYSNKPVEVQKLPKVGSYVHLDLERIVALKPDLCLAFRDGNPKHIIDKLSAMGIPVYVMDPRSLEGIMDSIARLGDIVQARERAAEQIRVMRMRLDRVAVRIARIKKRTKVFFQIADAPIVSAGTDTFIHKLITRAGGINLAAGNIAYPRFSWENVLVMQPEVVLITSMSGAQTEAELMSVWQKWPQVSAVRNNRVYVVEADQFDRPTARLLDGLERLVDILHPEERGGD